MCVCYYICNVGQWALCMDKPFALTLVTCYIIGMMYIAGGIFSYRLGV